MNSKYTWWLLLYGVILLLSLFLIFFVWKSYDPVSWDSSFVVTSDGLNHFSKWMDIAGWVSLTYEIDLSKYQQVYTDQMEYASVIRWVKEIILQNIDTRISSLWVSDYTSYIQSLEDGEYVVIEIWWVSDLDQAKEIIGKTVELEFKLPYEWDGTDQRISRQLLAEELLKQAIASPETMADLGLTYAQDNVIYRSYSWATIDELPQLYQQNQDLLEPRQPWTVLPALTSGVYGEWLRFQATTPVQETLEWFLITRFNWSSQVPVPDESGTSETTQTVYNIEEILVESRPSWVIAQDPISGDILNGAFFRFASVSQSQTWQPVATITFDERWKQIFCNITDVIVWKQMAIFIGGELVTAPVIREKICGWSAQIDGQFDMAWARQLVDELNEWALPAPLILSQEEKVSPVLWEQALTWAMLAGVVWLCCIYAYMVWLYGFKRWSVAVLTLVSFIIVLLWVAKLFGYAFSLSWIAAILLSLGMWVDANVLIYERIDEERLWGSSRSQAIEDGYNKSYSAIRDWNVTTLMIALLLFFVGTNVFKWFGTMMMLNIILTLAIIVPLTKRLLHVFYSE